MRFRLYPSPAQEVGLVRHCADARYVWNLALEQQNMYRPTFGGTPWLAEQGRQLTEARACTWLGEGSSAIQGQALRDLDQAFRLWRNNPSHFGRPTWRRRGEHEGFRVSGKRNWRWQRLSRKRAQVLVPKVGWVDWRWTRDPGKPKSYRVKRDAAGRWWIAFAGPPPDPVAGPSDGSIVGVDLGVAVAFTMSDGKQVTIRGLSDHEEARLLRLRRKMSRQHKGSRRRETTKRQIGRVRAREVNRRKDTVEKLTTHLAENYDLIRIENLRIGDMVRSAKGTVERPGKNVNQKRGMNRGILRSGWGMFAQRLEDKAPGRVERIHPTNTSRRCAVCDHVAEGNRKSQAVFLCVSCGHRDNADVNAAKNIAAGHAVTARGGPKVGPLNREPRSLSVEGDRNPPSGEDVKLIADDHLCSVVT